MAMLLSEYKLICILVQNGVPEKMVGLEHFIRIIHSLQPKRKFSTDHLNYNLISKHSLVFLLTNSPAAVIS